MVKVIAQIKATECEEFVVTGKTNISEDYKADAQALFTLLCRYIPDGTYIQLMTYLEKFEDFLEINPYGYNMTIEHYFAWLDNQEN